MQYSIVNYSHPTVHYIPRTYLSYNWKFVDYEIFGEEEKGREGSSGREMSQSIEPWPVKACLWTGETLSIGYLWTVILDETGRWNQARWPQLRSLAFNPVYDVYVQNVIV